MVLLVLPVPIFFLGCAGIQTGQSLSEYVETNLTILLGLTGFDWAYYSRL
jgi:hypothetical protein